MSLENEDKPEESFTFSEVLNKCDHKNLAIDDTGNIDWSQTELNTINKNKRNVA